jgi:site-specific recombinase XerD
MLTKEQQNQKEQALQKLSTDIQLCGYSNDTRILYLSHVEKFLNFCNRPIDELNELDARKFLLHINTVEKKKPTTVNVYNASIRFFFAFTLNRTMNYLQMPRMKKNKALPVILSREEINTLVTNCTNLKHKAQILLMYGSGLRSSEVAKLKTIDIDSKSMRVLVREGKGGKDRYTILSEAALEALRDYWRRYRPKSDDGYIFPSYGKNKHIIAAAVWYGVKKTAQIAEIGKNIKAHTLRHCFATHLYEDGYDLLEIKKLMGHTCIRSTIIYIYLANTTGHVKSPADNTNKTVNVVSADNKVSGKENRHD